MFKHTVRFLFLLLISILIHPCLLSAEKNSDFIEIISTGVGRNSDEAQRHALRAAVEQAVGTLVDSETLVENEDVINDQIIVYSAGFVESHEIIGTPKAIDGLVQVKIKAFVRKTQLAEKIQSVNIQSKDIDGESIFGKVITKIEQRESGEQLIRKTMAGFPVNVIEAVVVGAPDYDEDKKRVTLTIKVTLNTEKYNEFILNLKTVLNHVAKAKISPELTMSHGGQPKNLYLKIASVPIASCEGCLGWELIEQWDARSLIFLFSQFNDSMTNGKVEIFEVDKSIAEATFVTRPKISISIVDKDNATITSTTIFAPVPCSYHNPYMSQRNNENIHRLIHPFLIEKWHRDMHQRNTYIMNPGQKSIVYGISFDASLDEVRRMRNVICEIQ